MEADMSMEEVLHGIQKLKNELGVLNKKKVKKSHPDLMKNALYYFPDWQTAIDRSLL
ncbi:hypothetical protein SAMN05421736_101443 [Evansella caseinilytica]|uniref:Uncharacterized protein n=1 Tax=Evansella caseinilytica TaxID=1503961 RepID=A0A1H3HDN8_9BACI|nr:hypothetical protein [Evansella caseinilytica]SDY12759.1 hypothetical protein SAMN05421736_101443 [Evansella caseinilytica]